MDPPAQTRSAGADGMKAKSKECSGRTGPPPRPRCPARDAWRGRSRQRRPRYPAAASRHDARRSRTGRAGTLLAAWLAAAALSTIAAAASPPAVRIAGVTYLGDLPTLVADRHGLFARASVDAKVEYAASGKHNLERLRAGQTDFALMELTPLVLDLLADDTPGEADDPVILASLVHSGLLNQVVARPASSLQAPRDLDGRRVGLMKGTSAEVVWWLFATYHDLDPESVELVDLAIDTIPDALVAGTIDAAVMWDPWTSRLQQRLGGNLTVFPGSDVYIAKWVLVTRNRMVQEHAALCAAILGAYRQAIERIGARPDAALELYAEHAGVALGTLQPSWEAPLYDLNLDWSLIAAVQQQFEWARHAGRAAGPATPSALGLFAPGPLRGVAPVAVGIPHARRATDEPSR